MLTGQFTIAFLINTSLVSIKETLVLYCTVLCHPECCCCPCTDELYFASNIFVKNVNKGGPRIHTCVKTHKTWLTSTTAGVLPLRSFANQFQDFSSNPIKSSHFKRISLSREWKALDGTLKTVTPSWLLASRSVIQGFWCCRHSIMARSKTF